jgi:hypothetical protein
MGNSFFSKKRVVVSDYERGFRDGLTCAYSYIFNTLISVFISASFNSALTSKTLFKAFNKIAVLHKSKIKEVTKKKKIDYKLIDVFQKECLKDKREFGACGCKKHEDSTHICGRSCFTKKYQKELEGKK